MTFSEQKFQPFVLIDGDGAAEIVAPSHLLGWPSAIGRAGKCSKWASSG